MKKLILIPLIAALLSSCAIFQNHTSAQLLYSGVVSTALQYLVPKTMVKEVATDFQAASNLYDKFAGPDGLPTPDQATLILNTYLPNTPDKSLAVGTIMTIYWTYYPTWTKYDASTQLGYLKDFLAGAKAGSAPYL